MEYENNNYIQKSLHKPVIKWEIFSLKYFAYISVVLISAFLYWNSINGDLVHDDLVAVVRNPDVIGDTPIMEVLVHDFWGKKISSPSSHKSYRPITTLSLR